jgi:hypothetical protein
MGRRHMQERILYFLEERRKGWMGFTKNKKSHALAPPCETIYKCGLPPLIFIKVLPIYYP